MHFPDVVKEFLLDRKYAIVIYENKVHLFQYLDIIDVSEKKINILFNNFALKIIGNNLKIKKVSKEELLVEGVIAALEKKYD